jgi:acetyl-CoA carboxylase biotin carboxyl carrier protein
VAVPDNNIEVKSPMVGTFYRSSKPGTPPFVKVGDRVAEGEVLCIVEAMKLMNELESEDSGTIREILIENAQPVQFGQVLFHIQPD